MSVISDTLEPNVMYEQEALKELDSQIESLFGSQIKDRLDRYSRNNLSTVPNSNPTIKDYKVWTTAKNQMVGNNARNRTVSLAVLLSKLHGVNFDEAASLLNISPQKLKSYIQFKATVPDTMYEKKIKPLAEVLRHLHMVLEPAATSKWLNTSIPDLKGKTPKYSIQHNRIKELLEVARKYTEPVAYL